MPVASKAEFIKLIRASRVISDDKLKQAVAKFPGDDVKKFAASLVSSKLLTPWQAKFLYSGRHGLRLGNFVLQKRLRQDELGDRFYARHENLDRPVEIQVLPKAVTDDPALKDSFVNNIGQITELDQPYVAQVHDVDQAGGRYFLVEETLEGLGLNETVIDGKGLVRCTYQMLSALAGSHKHGIIHGNVCEENIVVLENGHFKLRGMGLSALKNQLNGQTEVSAKSDLSQLVGLLDSRFDLLPEEEQSQFKWLNEELSQLKANPIATFPRVIKKTESVMAGWSDAPESTTSPVSPISLDSPELEIAEATELKLSEPVELELTPDPATDPLNRSAAIVSSSPAASRRKSGKARRSKAKAGTVGEIKPATPWFKQPLALGGIGLGLLLCLTTLGLWLGGFFGASDSDKKVVTSNTQTKQTSNNVEKEPNPTEESENESKDNEANSTRKKNNYAPKEEKANIDPSDIAAALAKAKKELPPKKQPTLPQENPGQQPAANPEAPDAGNKSEQPTIEPANPTPEQPEPEGEQPKAPEAENPPVEKPPEQQPAPPKKPPVFTGLPDAIPFPRSDDTSEFQLGEFATDVESLNLELVISPESFNRGKGTLVLIPEGESAWTLGFSNKSNADKTETVGRFQFADSILTYKWADKINKKNGANHIRNGFLRVGALGQTKEVTLRNPTQIESLALKPEEYQQKINVDAEFLPAPTAIKVVLGKPAGGWPQRIYANDSLLEKTYTFDEALTQLPIYFDPDEPNQHVSVVVKPNVTNRLSFEMTVFVRGKDTPALEIADHDSIVRLFEQLHSSQQVLFNQKRVAERDADNAPNGQKTKAREFAKSVKKEYELASENCSIVGEVRDLLAGTHNSALPMTVYYELNGRRVIIATNEANE